MSNVGFDPAKELEGIDVGRLRSLNPRSLVFTIGFFAGVVGLAWQRDQNQRKANAESFLIDTEYGEASISGVAQDLCPKAFPLPPGDTAVTGDSGKSRSRSLDDKSS